MWCSGRFLNTLAAASLGAGLAAAGPAAAEEPVDGLLAQLGREDLANWQQVENAVVAEWSESGSPAMDLLLRRGREALKAGDTRLAIEHLTALTDHAPRFAEGWNARATAYFKAGLYGPAMRDLHIALSLNPRHFGALTGVGTILEQTGHPKDALAAYEAAEDINPHRPEIEKAIARLAPQVSGLDL